MMLWRDCVELISLIFPACFVMGGVGVFRWM